MTPFWVGNPDFKSRHYKRGSGNHPDGVKMTQKGVIFGKGPFEGVKSGKMGDIMEMGNGDILMILK